MGYLITQIIICLLIAAIIGFIIGWLLRGVSVNRLESTENSGFGLTDAETNDDELIPEPVTKAPSISHKVEKIDGIEKGVVKILHKNGINTTKELLERCANKHGFQQITSITDASETTVRQWVSRADLMRILDVDGHLAHLIEACGIKSTKALEKVDPQALINEMQNVNQREQIITQSTTLPDLKQMSNLIREARTL